jgi:ribosomal peptide maturation radical SAM protein 1
MPSLDPTGDPRVLLVSAPWTSLNEPSLGLAILRAVLDEQRIACRVLHLNIFTLEFLQAHTYSAIARVYALNDFVFSGLLDPEVTRPQRRLLWEKCSELIALDLIDHRQYGGIPGVVEQILRLRSAVLPGWVDRQVEKLLQWQPTLVGFTCMFDQTIASVAIASRIKKLAPSLPIVLGGYAVRSPTGGMLLESFPFIDAVCSGEGEPCITGLARESTAADPDFSRVPNLLVRSSTGNVIETERAGPVDLNTIPVPNFGDFYRDVQTLQEESAVEIAVDRLPVENSRGCWWGAVHHCVFCGIHDDDLSYRARDAELVLQTLDELNRRHGATEFRFSDYILPHRYYSTLLPELKLRNKPYRLKCELKANIREEQLQLLVDAGFVEVQPGIESFCSESLRTMDKGVSGTQNVYLLLLARRYGIVILYNILYGLPHEDARKCEALVQNLPHLVHLDPPATRMRVQITRYAPMQTNPRRFGLSQTRHERSYDLIFSDRFLTQSGFDLDRYCYIFEHPLEPSPRLARCYRRIDEICDSWNMTYTRQDADLLYDRLEDGGMMVHDTRGAEARTYILNEAEANFLIRTESPQRLAVLRRTAASDDFELILGALRDLGLLFLDGGMVLSLALPRSGVAPRVHWWNNYETRWKRTLPAKSKEVEVTGTAEGPRLRSSEQWD